MKESLFDISGKFLGGRRQFEAKVPSGTEKGYMEKYKVLLDSGEYLQMTFEKAEGDGTLSRVENGVVISMAPEEINGQPYDLRYKSQKLADTYYVKVVGVDENAAKVWVSCNAARMELRPQIEEEINAKLNQKKKGAPIRVKGKVLRVQSRIVDGESMDTGLWLDLCGVGILGYIYIGDWAQTYTPSLKGLVSYGDIVEVQIKERRTRKQAKGEVVYYSCTRKELVDNPWESRMLTEKYHEGDIVRIKCLSLKEGHWFGEINGLSSIQVFAEYPSAARDFPIIPGMEYMGKIYHMNTKERSLKVRVFQALTLDGYAEAGTGKEETDA